MAINATIASRPFANLSTTFRGKTKYRRSHKPSTMRYRALHEALRPVLAQLLTIFPNPRQILQHQLVNSSTLTPQEPTTLQHKMLSLSRHPFRYPMVLPLLLGHAYDIRYHRAPGIETLLAQLHRKLRSCRDEGASQGLGRSTPPQVHIWGLLGGFWG